MPLKPLILLVETQISEIALTYIVLALTFYFLFPSLKPFN